MPNILNISHSIQDSTVENSATVEIPMFMSDESREIAILILKVGIWPVIGVVGIIGNIISGIVLKKTGLKQPSNIFLLALAVADSAFLILAIDVSSILPFVTGKTNGLFQYWEFSYSVSLALFYISVVVQVVSRFGQRISATLTVVIGFERLIAVFFPLKFVTIVTIKRAWLIVAGTFLFWLPWTVFVGFWFKFGYFQLEGETYAGVLYNSDVFLSTEFDVQFFNANVVSHLSHTVPLALVTASCIILSVKVTLTKRKREKLVSSTTNQKSSSSSRTSITLLLVCSVYSVSRFTYLLEYLPMFNVNVRYWENLAFVYFFIREAVLFINSACNFFIYVVFNPKFRKTLTTVLCAKSTEKKVQNPQKS